MKKIPAYTLSEILLVLAIIGILTMIAIPTVMPLISKAKSTEAKMQLKFIANLQEQHRYINSKYTTELGALDFIAPKPVTQDGTANYTYEIIEASTSSFKARALAIVDFDGDGIFNIWEIDENGNPKEVVKD